jgi:hypothetical protein
LSIIRLFDAVSDAKDELGLDVDELVLILRPEIKSEIPGQSTVLDIEFLRRLIVFLADLYVENQSKTLLKKYLVMKLENDMGM